MRPKIMPILSGKMEGLVLIHLMMALAMIQNHEYRMLGVTKW